MNNYSVRSVKKIFFLTLVIKVLLFMSCSRENQYSGNKAPLNPPDKDQMLKANRNVARSEQAMIDDYINRYRWNMTETGSGLHYMIYRVSNGSQASKGMVARIAYETSLLNGAIIYTSEDQGIKEFVIGRGGVESGLEEGILLMKEGEKAKFIIPSHLAFGLVGDGKKIPSKATLVYDIELLKLIVP